MAIIHVTERHDFKNCRRLWKYAYKEHLKKPEEPLNALWIGRGLHAGLAEFYRKGNPIKGFHVWLDKVLPQPKRDALPMEDFRKLQEIIELCECILNNYITFANQNDSFEVVAVEKPFSAKISGTHARLVGTLDLVIRLKNRLWVLDHKSCQTFIDPRNLEIDDQMTSYMWLVWKTFGELPVGAIYNQLRKKLPVEPYLLKSGKSLSKDRSIDTTPEKYLEAIHAHGFNEEDYVEVLEKLALNQFFKRELIARSQQELESFEKHLQDEAREMTSKRTPIYPNPGQFCFWCDYLNLCKAENEGGDVQSLKDALYVVEPGRRL